MAKSKLKLKKVNKFQLIIYILTILGYIAGYVFFLKSILSLSSIETPIRIGVLIFFGLWFLLYLIHGLVLLMSKKQVRYLIFTLFTLLFIPLFGTSSYFVDKIVNKIGNVNKDKVTYSASLISLKDTEFAKDSKLGMISNENEVEGYKLANKLIDKENLSNEITSYDDYFEMLTAMYAKEIDACFVSSNYVSLYSNEELFSEIATDTKVLYSYEEEMENQDNQALVSSGKQLTEPFTILLMGVDSEINGLNPNQAFNGDTLMMVTFNPKTLSATMFSIPRDMYVPISCRNGAYNKINSSAAYGATCVINTVKNLTGVDIDYYVKINFKGVVDLVDALGGVTVDVQKPYFTFNNGVNYHGQVCEQNSNRQFGSKIICIDPGIQTLNGEQALAYARNRHQYLESDIDRNRHQQDVIEAVLSKAKTLRSFSDFENVLTAVSNNLDTNMTQSQILSLYNVGKSALLSSSAEDSIISITKTSLAYYNLPVYQIGTRAYTSALGYYPDSLKAIVKSMKENLELEEKEDIKTLEFSYNENYTTPIVGKNITTGARLELIPNFVGTTEGYVRSWASARGIGVNATTVDSTSPYYNFGYGAGYVGVQVTHEGTLAKECGTINVYINGANVSSSETTTEAETE